MFSSSGKLSSHLKSLPAPERLLLTCIVLGTSLVIFHCLPLIVTPYQIDYGEGLMLDGALRIRHAEPLYPSPFTFPVVLHVYGPAAYATVAAILPSGAASFPAGRWLILSCSIALALLIGTILRRLTGSAGIAFSFGFLLLTLPAFRFWIVFLRADVIGILFSVIGIVIYVSNEKRYLWTIPFFSLALFCKYSLLAAPIAVLLHLIVNRKLKKAFILALGLGGVATLAFVVFQITTGGCFAFHMFSTHSDRYSVMQFLTLAALVAGSAPVVTFLALWNVRREFREETISFPSIFLVVSFATALTAGKLGSTTNHFVEFMVACCLCAGIGYSVLVATSVKSARLITLLLAVSVLLGIFLQNRPSQQPLRDLAGCGEAYQYVSQSSSSRILSESLGPLLVTGKPVLVSDPFVYGQLLKHGLWPDQHVEDLVKARYFGLIVMSAEPSQVVTQGSDVWPDSLANAIGKNYKISRRFNCRDVRLALEPNSSNQVP